VRVRFAEEGGDRDDPEHGTTLSEKLVECGTG